MTQFVESTCFAVADGKAVQPAFRVSINVVYITAVVAHPDGGAILRVVGNGGNEHWSAVMQTLNR